MDACLLFCYDNRGLNHFDQLENNFESDSGGGNYCNAIAHKWTCDNIIEENYEYFSHCKLKADPGAFSVY